MLCRFGLYLTGDPELAREMAQETIRVALSKEWPEGVDSALNNATQTGGDVAVAAKGKWLRGILRNLVRNEHHKQQRSRLLFDSEMVETAEGRFVETGSDRDEVWQARKAALALCLAKLSRDEQELLRRRYQEGAAVKDLARMSRLEANSLSKRLERARRALRECVERSLKGEVHE